MLSNRSASLFRECRYGSAVTSAQTEDEVYGTKLKLDVPQSCPAHCSPRRVWTIPATKSGSMHSPALATQSRQNLLHTDLSSWNLSSFAALWLLNPGAGKCPCAGAEPVLGQEGWRAARASRSCHQEPQAIISKLLFPFATPQELDCIQNAATFAKSCKSQPESPNLLGNTQIVPGCCVRCLHLSRGWEKLLEGPGDNCLLQWNSIPNPIKNGSVSC